MRPLQSFQVRVRLPDALTGLREIAANLAWVWDPAARSLFRRVDPGLWDAHRDPIRVLASSAPGRLEELARDPAYVAAVDDVAESFRRARDERRWFQERDGSSLRSVAYFSPEFGIAEAIPQYSGGLGALAGDHLKAASDLGIPLVGVGLMYQHGYFRQVLDPEGWQQERYPSLDPESMALTAEDVLPVSVELGDDVVRARVWRADVGRIRLYLLDTNDESNAPDVRGVTDRLYGGGQEHRIRQEIVLGMGGVKALDALGVEPQVFHTNEGHAAFLALERIRRLVVERGLAFDEAVQAVRAGTIFTTHTSVPAGIDRFPRELVERYFSGWAQACGITVDDLMALGAEPGATEDGPFNMAAMAFRLTAFANGVSELHGEVSRRLFSGLWRDVEPADVPITSITNGVHARSWVSDEMDELLTREVGADWHAGDVARWDAAWRLPDEELWAHRRTARSRLVAFVRSRMRSTLVAKGANEQDLWWCDEVLDPDALTIGFARRFAGYKRATLLLSRPDRLKALLSSRDRPVQLVFAGKAHPADEWGKDMIRQLASFARQPDVWRRMVFVEDYDIAVARTLYQGCDVWLNTPRRPHEACGTSGMKAALNGSLNCSILDGWWDELFDGYNGWAIPSAELYEDHERRDEAEAGGLFELLEHRVVPLFYERDGEVPRGWIQRMKASLRSLAPRITASRMVRDYTTRLYEPAAAHADALWEDDLAGARDLAAWKRRVIGAWDGVTCALDAWEPTSVELGAKRDVRATVTLGELGPDDVEVQLLHGPLDASEELRDVSVVRMDHVGAPASTRAAAYAATFAPEQPGRYGFTIRVVPSHPHLRTFAELGRVVRTQ